MDKTMNISFIYGICACLSLMLAFGYCALVRRKEIWLIWLYFSVFIANLGYFALSISRTLEGALMANRLAYLGCVFLPLFMLMTIIRVCQLKCPGIVACILIGISIVVFLIAASQGYLDIYYKEVSLVSVNGMTKIEKMYGPLHNIYFIYLLVYLGVMIGTICIATVKREIASYKHSAMLVVVAILNIAIWLVEQLIDWDFEFLSVSYIASELLLLLLLGMIEDYESSKRQTKLFYPSQGTFLPSLEDVMAKWPKVQCLSNREKEVLEGILKGKKRKEIAEDLYITENTVKKHISNIFSKLEVTSRDEMFEKIRQIHS